MFRETWKDGEWTCLHLFFSSDKQCRETLSEFSHHNKGFINYFFLQKLGCQKPCWDQARLSSLINKQVGADVVVGLAASAVAVLGLVASAFAVNSCPSAGSKEQLGRVLHATASKISLQDWQKFNLNRLMKSKLIPSKS